MAMLREDFYCKRINYAIIGCYVCVGLLACNVLVNVYSLSQLQKKSAQAVQMVEKAGQRLGRINKELDQRSQERETSHLRDDKNLSFIFR
jgi:hypothetical protein